MEVGNRLSASFAACVDEDEQGDPLPQLDGKLSYVIRALGGEIGTDFFLVTLDLDFDAFEVTDGADSLQTDGGATATYDTTSPPFAASAASGPSLDLKLVEIGATSQFELRDFDNSLVDDTGVAEGDSFSDGVAAGKYTLDGRGRLTSSCFTGEARYDTVAPLDGDKVEEDQFVVGGDLRIEGADGVDIRLVELSSTEVELQVDVNSDGEIEDSETLTTSWAELLESADCDLLQP
jgi:hypothetical protein